MHHLALESTTKWSMQTIKMLYVYQTTENFTATSFFGVSCRYFRSPFAIQVNIQYNVYYSNVYFLGLSIWMTASFRAVKYFQGAIMGILSPFNCPGFKYFGCVITIFCREKIVKSRMINGANSRLISNQRYQFLMTVSTERFFDWTGVVSEVIACKGDPLVFGTDNIR